MEPIFFASPAEFRAWMEEYHDKEPELLVGYYKKHTGNRGMSWKEAVDVALCFGWIDSIARTIDADAYTIRFTPRKARSNWSHVNIKRVGELIELGLMHPAGLQAFEARGKDQPGMYVSEQAEIKLDATDEAQLQANEKAAAFFAKQSPSYKKAAIWWVISAKKAETKQKRLAQLIDDSASEKRSSAFNGGAKKK
jgi:uncharacterized protein YdeI (YjbR/CyaY-like superfamily)